MNFSISNLQALAALLLCTLLGFAFSGGSTETTGQGATGAPTADGFERKCGNCHRGGNYGEPELEVLFALDGNDPADALTSYVPGQTYRVSLTVGSTVQSAAGYGFQLQVLTDQELPLTAGTLSDPADGSQVSEATATMRNYVEQSMTSTDSVFTFTWTAPAAGTGSVNIHAVGTLVNGLDGADGDNGSNTPLVLKLSEEGATSVADFTPLSASMSPNPVFASTQVQVNVEIEQGGTYQLGIHDLSGKQLRHTAVELTAGPVTQSIPTDGLRAGAYLVTLEGRGARWVGKLLVR